MEIITKDKLEEIKKKARSNPIYEAMEVLKPGEILRIDDLYEGTPRIWCNRIRVKFKGKYKAYRVKTDLIIERV